MRSIISISDFQLQSELGGFWHQYRELENELSYWPSFLLLMVKTMLGTCLEYISWKHQIIFVCKHFSRKVPCNLTASKSTSAIINVCAFLRLFRLPFDKYCFSGTAISRKTSYFLDFSNFSLACESLSFWHMVVESLQQSCLRFNTIREL